MRSAACLLRTALQSMLLMIAAVATGKAPAQERRTIVAVNNYVDGDFQPTSYHLGLLPDLIVNAQEKHYQESIPKKLRPLQRSLPHLDFTAFFASRLHCLPLGDGSAPCNPTSVIEGDESRLADAIRHGAGPTTLVDITIDYRGKGFSRRGFVLTYRYSEYGTPASTQTDRAYTFLFFEPAPDGLKGMPLDDDPAGSGPSDDLRLARDYWFSGTPSRFEGLLERSASDFLLATNGVYAHLGPPRHDPSQESWWNALPRLGALRDSGQLPCRGMECRRPYLLMQEGRLIYFPDTRPQQILVSSDNLSMWER